MKKVQLTKEQYDKIIKGLEALRVQAIAYKAALLGIPGVGAVLRYLPIVGPLFKAEHTAYDSIIAYVEHSKKTLTSAYNENRVTEGLLGAIVAGADNLLETLKDISPVKPVVDTIADIKNIIIGIAEKSKEISKEIIMTAKQAVTITKIGIPILLALLGIGGIAFIYNFIKKGSLISIGGIDDVIKEYKIGRMVSRKAFARARSLERRGWKVVGIHQPIGMYFSKDYASTWHLRYSKPDVPYNYLIHLNTGEMIIERR